MMDGYDYCKTCGEYVPLERHQKTTRIYEARFEPEDDWELICGDYYQLLTEEQNRDAPKSAAERFCRKIDQEDCHRIEDNRTVWVRRQGEESEGQPYQVETEMVPQYRAVELKPCAGGCERLVPYGWKCHACMRAEREAKKAKAS